MIKLIIFDLDGVLVDTKELHYEVLNEAIELIAGKEYIISYNEHISNYDGLNTNEKLKKLTRDKGLSVSTHSDIWKTKQQLTLSKLSEVGDDKRLDDIFKELKDLGYMFACCSNSIRETVYTVLSNLGIMKYMKLVLSNEDVKNSKPHPELYWKCMSMLGFDPNQTLIVEDSPVGLLAANYSNAHILRVDNSMGVSTNVILEEISNINKKRKKMYTWKDEKITVVIPMAGLGSRFEKEGYKNPKPLIDVKGAPMIQRVVESLNIEANYIFIVQKKHRVEYNLDLVLDGIVPGCQIVDVDGITEGAACTVLLTERFINNDNPIIIANSDQLVEWDSSSFMYQVYINCVDAEILTFESTHPKWSYVELDKDKNVIRVEEKNPISNIATVGIYYWKKGSDFVKYSKEMIEKNDRFNNEFYVAPVFNYAIKDNKKIKIYNVDKMIGVGTPEDLNIYLHGDV